MLQDDFAKTLAEVRQSATNVKELIAKFKDGTIPDDLERTLNNVADSTARLKTMIAAFQPSTDGGEGMLGDVRATLGSTREVMSGLSEDLEALKRSFFFRSFFKDRGFYNLNDLSRPPSTNQKNSINRFTRNASRFQQAHLFTVKADGTEEISAQGRGELDLAMAHFLRFTKDRAIIVEGYASAGSRTKVSAFA